MWCDLQEGIEEEFGAFANVKEFYTGLHVIRRKGRAAAKPMTPERRLAYQRKYTAKANAEVKAIRVERRSAATWKRCHKNWRAKVTAEIRALRDARRVST